MSSRKPTKSVVAAALPLSALPRRQAAEQVSDLQARGGARQRVIAQREAQARRVMSFAIMLIAALTAMFLITVLAPQLPGTLLQQARIAWTDRSLSLHASAFACVPLGYEPSDTSPAHVSHTHVNAHILVEHAPLLQQQCEAYVAQRGRCILPGNATSCDTAAAGVLVLTVYVRDETTQLNKFSRPACDYHGMLQANRALFAAIHGYTSLIVDDDAVVRWKIPVKSVAAMPGDAADDAALNVLPDLASKIQPFNNGGRRWQPYVPTGNVNARPASWAKVATLLHLMRSPDAPRWVLTMDADAIITAFNVPLDGLLQQATSVGADIVCTKDRLGLNAGVFLIRNSPWSRSFLRLVWQMTPFVHELTWEQAAITALLEAQPHLKSHVLFVPQRRLNAYLPDNVDVTARWQQGDFLVHCAGLRPERFQAVAANLSAFLPATWPTHAACVRPSVLASLWG